MAGEPDDVDAMIEPVVPSRHRWLAGLDLSAAALAMTTGAVTGAVAGLARRRRYCASRPT